MNQSIGQIDRLAAQSASRLPAQSLTKARGVQVAINDKARDGALRHRQRSLGPKRQLQSGLAAARPGYTAVEFS